jgi:hypothetical protein
MALLCVRDWVRAGLLTEADVQVILERTPIEVIRKHDARK